MHLIILMYIMQTLVRPKPRAFFLQGLKPLIPMPMFAVIFDL